MSETRYQKRMRKEKARAEAEARRAESEDLEPYEDQVIDSSSGAGSIFQSLKDAFLARRPTATAEVDEDHEEEEEEDDGYEDDGGDDGDAIDLTDGDVDIVVDGDAEKPDAIVKKRGAKQAAGAEPPTEGPYPTDPADVSDFPEVGPNSIATIGQRGFARVTDFVISFMIPGALMTWLLYTPNTQEIETADGEKVLEYFGSDAALVAVALVPLATLFLYEVVMTRWQGRTVGKMIGGLKVVDFETGEPPSTIEAIKRAAIPVLVLLAARFLIGDLAMLVYAAIYLSAAWAADKSRGWPDKIGRTVVIRTK